MIIKPGDIKNKSSTLCIATKRERDIYIYIKILELVYEIQTNDIVVLESEIRERMGTTKTDMLLDSK